MRLVIKTARFALGVFLLVSLVQLSSAWYLQRPPQAPGQTDLVVVFPGDDNRFAAGCQLVKNGHSSRLMIINQSASSMKAIAKKHHVPAGIILLPGGTSRSSFEDAFRTSEAITDLGVRSVTLVTSAYHLPRALFLLKSVLALNGKEIAVHHYPVQDEHPTKRKLQLYYNELLKLWGSSSEMAGYFVSGHLVLDYKIILRGKAWLKKKLLFDV
ncbi:YdcF family protein [Desulfofustis limnaeus]|uniref:DUF218 domain-containing protein n=1 Tax=Desulfofustis limnaeus TaxID=2740163 RepID=A0ABM7W9X5_9BACT|nr:YdcF family protein [Desulfofustis limnaeus]BDD87673.1 hypothetical protein DPPLL_20380 [Desulfofustis limnaeus]